MRAERPIAGARTLVLCLDVVAFGAAVVVVIHVRSIQLDRVKRSYFRHVFELTFLPSLTAEKGLGNGIASYGVCPSPSPKN